MAEPKPQSCCPIGSEPKLEATYKARGNLSTLGDLPIYTVGEGDKAIIMVYDIFGFDAGRIRLMCDQFADAGFFVILPDFFRAKPWEGEDWSKLGEFFKEFAWERLNGDLNTHIYPYLEQRGVKSIGAVGCCWGDYIVFQASASGKINAGVGFHPTLTKFAESADSLAERTKCPHFLMPAGNDPEELKEGGSVEKILKGKFGDKVRVKTFPDASHGWVPRGDLSNPNNARDYKEAMQLAIDYFKELL